MKGLKAIENLKKLKRRILVYFGDRRLEKKGIEILPLNDFIEDFLKV